MLLKKGVDSSSFLSKGERQTLERRKETSGVPGERGGKKLKRRTGLLKMQNRFRPGLKGAEEAVSAGERRRIYCAAKEKKVQTSSRRNERTIPPSIGGKKPVLGEFKKRLTRRIQRRRLKQKQSIGVA